MNLHIELRPSELHNAVKEYVSKRLAADMITTAVEIVRIDGGRMGVDTYSAKATVKQSGVAPEEPEVEVTGELHNWHASTVGGYTIYHGNIWGDTRGRFPDGTHVRTSPVEKVEGDLVTTRNSVYRLIGEA